MRKWILEIVLGIMMFTFTGAGLEALSFKQSKPWKGFISPSVKVLIVEDASSAFLEAKKGYNLYDPGLGKKIVTRFFGKSYQVQPYEDGLKWGEEFPGMYQMVVVPDSNSSLRVDGVEYKGNIYVYIVDDRINVVNEVSVDDYVTSLMASSLDHRINPEALEALAITLRTNTLERVLSDKSVFWNVKATEVGYEGYKPKMIKPEISQAIQTTKDLVLNSNGHLFPAMWTDNSGGKTGSYEKIFRHHPGVSMPGVNAPLALQDRNESLWEASIPLYELAHLVKLDSIDQITPFVEKESGKTYGFRFDGKQEGTKDNREVSFIALNHSLRGLLKSSDFTFTIKNGTVNFVGYGQGNGVGLCLHSAERMAEKGMSATQILSTFFPNAQVVHRGNGR